MNKFFRRTMLHLDVERVAWTKCARLSAQSELTTAVCWIPSVGEEHDE